MSATPTPVKRLIHAADDCSSFKPDAVCPGLVEESIREATQVHIHGLSRPGCFYFLGKQTVEALAKMNAERIAAKKDAQAAEKKLAEWLRVPGWLLVTCLKHRSPIITSQHYASCCCLVQSLRLLLAEKRVATAWTLPAVTRRMEFALLCSFNPEREDVVTLLRYGYSDDDGVASVSPEIQRHEPVISHRP